MSIKKLKTLIILLSSDSYAKKSTLLYETYEVDQILTEEAVDEMLEIISSLSVNLIWMALGKKPDQICIELLTQYEKKLLDGQPFFVDTGKRAVLQGRSKVDKPMFLRNLSRAPKLLDSLGVRTMIMKEYSDNLFLFHHKTLNLSIIHQKTADTQISDKTEATVSDSLNRSNNNCEVEELKSQVLDLQMKINEKAQDAIKKTKDMDSKIIEELRESIKNLENQNKQLQAKVKFFHEESVKSMIQLEKYEKKDIFSAEFLKDTHIGELEDKISNLDTKNKKYIALNAFKLAVQRHNQALQNSYNTWKSIKPKIVPKQATTNNVVFNPWKIETSDLSKDNYTATAIVSKETVEEIKTLVHKIVRKRRKFK